MNIRKLPSGSYQVRKQYKGKQYSFTLDHKPTQKEVIQLLADKLEEDPLEKGTFQAYANKYIEERKNILKGPTVHDYKGMLKSRISEEFKNMSFKDMTKNDVQAEINRYAVGRSPKTVRNLFNFINPIFKEYRPNLRLDISLPQKRKYKAYLPSNEEICKVIDYFIGTKYEVPIWLGIYGLRRSEVCGLSVSDLTEDNHLHIHSTMTYNEDGKYVVGEGNKTTESERDIVIAPYIADLIRKQGYVCNVHIESILKALHTCQEELSIPKFRLHDLRHYFATVMSKYFTDKDIMSAGGWSDTNVLKRIYEHSELEKSIDMKVRASELIEQNAKNLKVEKTENTEDIINQFSYWLNNVYSKKVGTEIGTKPEEP